MKFVNKEISVHLEINTSLLDQIFDLAKSHFPNEFGGFLIGYYTKKLDKLMVTDILIPDKYTNSPTTFVRNTINLESRLKQLYNEKPQKYYVGEWHSHPNGTTIYSTTDLNAMKSIAEHDTVNICNPILLIVALSKSKMIDYCFYLFKQNKLIKYD